jgi:hypothetical protein
LDAAIFKPEAVVSHAQITDIHLLALATRHGGRLATFDRSLSLKPVIGAKSGNLEHLLLAELDETALPREGHDPLKHKLG